MRKGEQNPVYKTNGNRADDNDKIIDFFTDGDL
jgi:hypothetical protein